MDYDQIGVNLFLIISDDHYDISADSKHDKALWVSLWSSDKINFKLVSALLDWSDI